jgi:hypothetical protein
METAILFVYSNYREVISQFTVLLVCLFFGSVCGGLRDVCFVGVEIPYLESPITAISGRCFCEAVYIDIQSKVRVWYSILMLVTCRVSNMCVSGCVVHGYLY